MTRAGLGASVLLATMLLAGCTGSSGNLDAPEETDTAAPSASDVVVNEETGGIAGTVVNDESVALVGVHILLQPVGLATSTALDGTFSYGELVPDTYTILVDHNGYLNAEVAVRVEPGVVAELHDPPIRLDSIPVLDVPHQASFTRAGRFDCHWSISAQVGGVTGECGTVPGVGPTPVNDAFAEEMTPLGFALEGEDWRGIVFEAQWTTGSTATRADMVQFFSFKERSCNHLFETSGPSEQSIWFVYSKGVAGLRKNIPTGDACGGQPAQPEPGLELVTWMEMPDAIWSSPFDLAMSVDFEMAVTVFYGMEVPAGYTYFAA